ncbi:type II secretion system protein [Rhodocyclus tenuis]|uniref:Type II secretion system protein n=1 Tax=Rhodocyclus gracilis TaxID=2929842 RepID=A0ABX0WJE5_9RHOO|nr:type II secretion system protein [Rhodocyclus gracilis]NJA88755.1 type II secretion system protein [Rhodocyclus gracilis]
MSGISAFAKSSGFTLVELIVVIVILGVLSATALPKFVDLGQDAQQAVTEGVAAGISSSSTINYAARKLDASRGIVVDDCSDATLLLDGGLPQGYSMGDSSLSLPVSPDVGQPCTVYGPRGTRADAILTGIR